MGNRERNIEMELCHEKDRHVHEIQGSVKIAEREDDPHNHRFCTVSGEAMSLGTDNHVHEVCFLTDTYEDHQHEFKGRTGGAIPVCDGRHVHFLESVTSMNDGHRHMFECATLIENPIGEEHKQHLEDHHHEEHRRHEHRRGEW